MVEYKNRNSSFVQRARNENGFALLGLVFISVLFFSTSLFFAFFTDILEDDLKLKKNCIELNWQYQANQKKNLEKILKLNPRALELRRKWILAQQRLVKAAASGQPVAIAAAKAYLLSVYYQKTQLATKQQSVLLKAKLEAQIFSAQLSRQIKSQDVSTATGGLAVVPDSVIEVASPYKPVEFFSNAQMSGATWRKPARSFVQPVIQKLISPAAWSKAALGRNISGQCFVTLERRNLKWFVTLAAKS